MGRLIDDIALKASITANEILETNKPLEDVIDEQPTVYDIEAVVKQIEKKAFPDFEEEYSCNGEQLVWLSDVLELVRRGGMK